MEKPVRTDDDSRLPLSATIAIGGLAVFGAITLVSWVFGALIGIVKFVLAGVVIVALLSWLTGRRIDR
ncbi:MAG: hypothetical protein U5K29_12610 [Acidimicrobiales bacterium]|nr:hypothetical protein [Acidimicrobiales bacterium]